MQINLTQIYEIRLRIRLRKSSIKKKKKVFEVLPETISSPMRNTCLLVLLFFLNIEKRACIEEIRQILTYYRS